MKKFSLKIRDSETGKMATIWLKSPDGLEASLSKLKEACSAHFMILDRRHEYSHLRPKRVLSENTQASSDKETV